MAKVGIVRRFDDLGRVCIPREIRMRFFGKSDVTNEPVEIFVDGENIVLKRYIEPEAKAEIDAIRAKAIKDFAERLHKVCGMQIGDCQYDDVLHEGRIDEIAKELTGE